MADPDGRLPDYGLAAPRAVRTMLLAGIVLAAVGAFLLLSQQTVLGIALLIVGALLALFQLGAAAVSIRSSRTGRMEAIDRLLDMMALDGGERVLDVGTRRGLMLVKAAKRLTTGKAVGMDTWGPEVQPSLDANAAMANARAEGVAERVEVRNGDVRQLPLPDGSFDVVVSGMVLHSLYDERSRGLAVREMARVLKPGGRLGIMDTKFADDYARTLRNLGWNEIRTSSSSFLTFPPIRFVTATKPRRR